MGLLADSDLPAITQVSNTLALPCAARRVFPIENDGQVVDAMRWAAAQNIPLIALGEGSNVVLPPQLQMGVLQVRDSSMELLAHERDTVTLRVGAGKGWHALVRDTLKQGYFGLENLALIPGLVGAAPVQNIGAYGCEIAQFVVAVHGVDLRTGESISLGKDDCGFAYRDSVFKHALRDRFLITRVDFALSTQARVNLSYAALSDSIESESPSPLDVFDAVVQLRRARLPDPSTTPNAGSFFKNPRVTPAALAALRDAHPAVPVYPLADGDSKIAAGWLIDQCGLRGRRCGGASVSSRHALVIVTHCSATQADVLQLARDVQERVASVFAVELEPEPRIYE